MIRKLCRKEKKLSLLFPGGKTIKSAKSHHFFSVLTSKCSYLMIYHLHVEQNKVSDTTQGFPQQKEVKQSKTT